MTHLQRLAAFKRFSLRVALYLAASNFPLGLTGFTDHAFPAKDMLLFSSRRAYGFIVEYFQNNNKKRDLHFQFSQ